LLSYASPPADHAGLTLGDPARSAAEPLRELLRLLQVDLPVIIFDDGSPKPLATLSTERPRGSREGRMHHNHRTLKGHHYPGGDNIPVASVESIARCGRTPDHR